MLLGLSQIVWTLSRTLVMLLGRLISPDVAEGCKHLI